MTSLANAMGGNISFPTKSFAASPRFFGPRSLPRAPGNAGVTTCHVGVDLTRPFGARVIRRLPEPRAVQTVDVGDRFRASSGEGNEPAVRRAGGGMGSSSTSGRPCAPKTGPATVVRMRVAALSDVQPARAPG